MMAFDTNQAPIVGQQVTLTATNGSVAGPRIDLLVQRANAGECDLIATTTAIKGAQAGFFYTGTGFRPASTLLPLVGDATLRSLVVQRVLPPLTFSCVPVGEGSRIAIDRDGDGYADYDEIACGKDPANPNSHP
jgi:CubicO group peptidase (beta-lactamase class C family)